MQSPSLMPSRRRALQKPAPLPRVFRPHIEALGPSRLDERFVEGRKERRLGNRLAPSQRRSQVDRAIAAQAQFPGQGVGALDGVFAETQTHEGKPMTREQCSQAGGRLIVQQLLASRSTESSHNLNPGNDRSPHLFCPGDEPLHVGRTFFGEVALRKRARIQVEDHRRSSMIRSAIDLPPFSLASGFIGGRRFPFHSARPASTIPLRRSSRLWPTGTNRPTGLPPSAVTHLRPCFSSRRNSLSRALSSRTPTVCSAIVASVVSVTTLYHKWIHQLAGSAKASASFKRSKACTHFLLLARRGFAK